MNTTLSGPKWPSLSFDLSGPKSPDRCQSCGFHSDLQVWREHNDFDGPTNTFVVLCPGCADRLIESHKRLYSLEHRYAPAPGAMPVCLDCRHRNGVSCPKSIASGGSGVRLSYAEPPARVHFYRRGKGARSGWETVYRGPVTACDGKAAAT